MYLFIQECITLCLHVGPTLGKPVAKISIIRIYRLHTLGPTSQNLCWAGDNDLNQYRMITLRNTCHLMKTQSACLRWPNVGSGSYGWLLVGVGFITLN